MIRNVVAFAAVLALGGSAFPQHPVGIHTVPIRPQFHNPGIARPAPLNGTAITRQHMGTLPYAPGSVLRDRHQYLYLAGHRLGIYGGFGGYGLYPIFIGSGYYADGGYDPVPDAGAGSADYGYYPVDPGLAIPTYPNSLVPLDPLPNDHPKTARLSLQIPAGAEVWIDDRKVEMPATSQVFESPELKPGESFTFKVRVTWREVGKVIEEKKTLNMKPGEFQSLQYLGTPIRITRAIGGDSGSHVAG